MLTAVVLAVAWPLGHSPAGAQAEKGAVALVGERLEQISPLNGQFHENRARGLRIVQSANFEASRRLGIAVERMAFGAREFRVRPLEVLGIDLSVTSREKAQRLGFEVLRSYRLKTLDIRVDVFRVPRGQSVKTALRRLQSADSEGAYEANSIFGPSAGVPHEFIRGGPASPSIEPAISAGAPARRMGIIDTGVDAGLEAFAGAVLAQQNFGRGDHVTPRPHGTAVAAIARVYGVEQLLIADAFSGEPSFADAEALARALDWMAAQDISVINMSLAGPPNALLRLAVARVVGKGYLIVAAVGNEGAGNPPEFPAAYPAVIGVTAVDMENKVYDRANRGDGVDVAALGVGVRPVGDKPLSGTSYAAPVVSAFLAWRLPPREPQPTETAMTLIAADATDLGEPGFDFTYGVGVLTAAFGQTKPSRERPQ